MPMNSSEIQIECPCCFSALRIDRESGKLLGWLRTGDTAEGVRRPATERWNEATGRVRGRVQAGEDSLDAALEKERARERELDELFRRAKDKLGEPPPAT